MNTTPLAEILSYDYLMWATDDRSFERALTIRTVDIVEETPTHVEACVQGTADEPYTVTIKAQGTIAIPSCTCPVEWAWCKHAVAVGLRLCPDVGEVRATVGRRCRFRPLPCNGTARSTDTPARFSRKDLQPDDRPLIISAIASVGTPQEVSVLMSKSVKSLADESRHTLITSRRHGGMWSVNDLYSDWDATLHNLSDYLAAGRGAFLLPSIEKTVDTLCELTEEDHSYVPLLARALDIHQHYCTSYDAGSTHLISWLETIIQRVVAQLPTYDFSPYSLCVDSLDLSAAITRARTAENLVLDAYLSLMIADDAPYCALLAQRGAWVSLATHYARSGRNDEARDIIHRAQDPASEVSIPAKNLGPLIRLYCGEEEYLHWLVDEAHAGNTDAARALTHHPRMPYDDVVAIITSLDIDLLTRQKLLFAAASFHRKTEDGLALLHTGNPIATTEEVFIFAEQQVAHTNPIECVSLLGNRIHSRADEGDTVTVSDYLARLRTMISTSPDALTQFYKLLKQILSAHPYDPELRRCLATRGLIPGWDA
ncbi:SWIM zinc finger family protein [Corynebacterium glucuronolyticum]|uniref:SWIM zinc finger family protein n=1 Tax=Corynebacterium glucuronolyticum TaxID=39791 RepID=UPI001F4081E4|nr:hypothetical protein [Corynebacterium glucuronolyticum]